MDIAADKDANEANVQIWREYYIGTIQKYRILKDALGKICIAPMLSNSRTLDIYYGSDSSKYSKNVQLYDYGMGSNQQWTFEKVTKKVYYSNNQNENSYFNRAKARDYTILNAKYENSVYDTQYYRKTGSGSECTNFVSGCLAAGGMVTKGDVLSRASDGAWHYATNPISGYFASYTWGAAPNFSRHWGHDFYGSGLQRAYMTIVYPTAELALNDWSYLYSILEPGDVIQTYHFDDYQANHSMIVHDWTSSDILYAQHTGNDSYLSLYKVLTKYNVSAPTHSFMFHIMKKG